MKTRTKRVLIIILIIIAVFVVLKLTVLKKFKHKAKAVPSQVASYTVKRGEISNKLDITGEIQPISTVQIKSRVSGKILKFYVDENDFVTAGSILCDIEPDYNQANTISSVKNNVKLMEIQLKNTQKDYNDKLSLQKANSASQQEVDKAKDDLDTAQINYQQAIEQYQLVKELDTNGKVTHVIAPASGTVIQRLVEVGEMVVSSNSGYGEGTVIMKVADLNRMIVKSNINEVDIDKFRIGQQASIEVDAFPYKEYTGKVTKIAAMATLDNNAKVFPIEITLAEVDKKLRPGMTANVTIQGESRKNVLIIPIRAVFSDSQDQDIVYLIKNGAIADSTYIKTGINDMENVEVIQGLKEGQTISLTEKSATADVQVHMGAQF